MKYFLKIVLFVLMTLSASGSHAWPWDTLGPKVEWSYEVVVRSEYNSFVSSLKFTVEGKKLGEYVPNTFVGGIDIDQRINIKGKDYGFLVVKWLSGRTERLYIFYPALYDGKDPNSMLVREFTSSSHIEFKKIKEYQYKVISYERVEDEVAPAFAKRVPVEVKVDFQKLAKELASKTKKAKKIRKSNSKVTK